MKELSINEKNKLIKKVCKELDAAEIKHLLITVIPDSSGVNAFTDNTLDEQDFYIGLYSVFRSITENSKTTVAELANDVRNFVRRYDKLYGDLVTKDECDES